MKGMRIVVVRLTALGDVLLATPALEAISLAHPGATLTLVTRPRYGPLVTGLPFVDQVVEWRERESVADLVAEVLRTGPVDLYVDLQHKLSTVRLGWALEPARRIAFRRRTLLGGLRSLLGREPPLSGRHASRLYLDVLARAGIEVPPGDGALQPRIALAPVAGNQTQEVLSSSRPRVGIAPGARWATKRWAPERFALVADRLVEEHGASIVLLGGVDDAAALESCAQAMQSRPAAQTLDLELPGLAALLEELDLLVTNDSGPGHLASALGVPVLGIFGPTAESRWAPSSPGSRVVHTDLDCRPCTNHGSARCPLHHHRCMLDLDPEAVFQVAAQVLS